MQWGRNDTCQAVWGEGEKWYIWKIVAEGKTTHFMSINVTILRYNASQRVTEHLWKWNQVEMLEYLMSYGYTAVLKELDVFHLLAFDVSIFLTLPKNAVKASMWPQKAFDGMCLYFILFKFFWKICNMKMGEKATTTTPNNHKTSQRQLNAMYTRSVNIAFLHVTIVVLTEYWTQYNLFQSQPSVFIDH